MRLVDLDPHWIMREGKRIGFTFRSPINPEMRQSCFEVPPQRREQWAIWDAMYGDASIVQGCTPGAHWQITGGIEAATFETMTVQPSLDGSAGGLWHGFITDGEIVGGI